MSARLGWHKIEMSTHVAVVPDYEDGHVLAAGGCWCDPRREAEPGSMAIVSHRDLAQRDGSALAITDQGVPE